MGKGCRPPVVIENFSQTSSLTRTTHTRRCVYIGTSGHTPQYCILCTYTYVCICLYVYIYSTPQYCTYTCIVYAYVYICTSSGSLRRAERRVFSISLSLSALSRTWAGHTHTHQLLKFHQHSVYHLQCIWFRLSFHLHTSAVDE